MILAEGICDASKSDLDRISSFLLILHHALREDYPMSYDVKNCPLGQIHSIAQAQRYPSPVGLKAFQQPITGLELT